MPTPPASANGRPRPAATRTALLLAGAALVVVAVTVALVLLGPRDRTPAMRTVSVAPFALADRAPPPWSFEGEVLAGIGIRAAAEVGRRLDGRGGLVWLPNAGGVPAADLAITGTIQRSAGGGAPFPLLYEATVPLADGIDTIRLTSRPGDGLGVPSALADSVLGALSGGRIAPPNRHLQRLGSAMPHEAGLRPLRERHGNRWSDGFWQAFLARRDELPIVERSILDAIAVPDLTARLDSLEAVAARFDSYWPALWMYADALVHYGALAGRPIDATVDALRSAIERVPRPWSTRLIRHRDALAARRGDAPAGAPGWAARGAWDSAFVRSAPSPEADAGEADAGALLDTYRLAVVGNWLGGVPPSAVAGRRRPIREEHLDAAGGAELAWLDGLAAAVAQDGGAIDRARLLLRESGAPSATDLERSLRAFQLATVEGEELRGARLLRSLERERASRLRLAMIEDDGHPYLTGVNRLAAAQWFIKHGRSSDALPLLGWWERLPVGAPGIEIADAVLAPVDELQRARAYREVGRPGDAARHFRRFLDGYDLAAGPHRTWVRDARAALASRP